MLSLFYLVALAVVFPLASSHDGHTCIHDFITSSLPAHAFQNAKSRQLYEDDHVANTSSRRTQTNTYSPIRMSFDTSRLQPNAEPQFACYAAGQQYQPTTAQKSTDRMNCQSTDILSASQRDYLISTVIPAAVSFFQNMLSVKPVSGNLVMPNPYPATSCCYDAANYCNAFVCCDPYFPSADRTVGVSNSDFHLYVTARPTGGSTIAWALTCQKDQYARPIAGHINFNPARVSTAPQDFASQLSTAVHELMHALGFSSSGFFDWRKPGTNNQESYSNIVWSGTERGNPVKKIITPNVVAAVKAHFDCYSWSSSTAGMEIEDFGGSGTAGSHWEKRLVMNEVMTGTADPNSVYSAITFAAFADMGWYQVSTAQAQRLPWGNGEGCSFVQDKCYNWPSRYFCSVPNQGGCSIDMRYRAQCNLMDTPYSLATQFQYFANYPNRGGSNGYVDYCPVYWRLSNGDCLSSSTIPLWFYGEQVGSVSRCFAGTYQRSSVMNTPAQHAGCLEAACSANNLLTVKLLQSGGTKLTITCPLLGGDVDLSSLPGSEFVGLLTCPPSSVMCTGNPCDANNCNSRGTCNPGDGTCSCQSGYFGSTAYDCQNIQCPLGRNSTGSMVPCAGHAACDYTDGRCKDESGQAGCYSGWADGPNGACSRLGCPTAPCNGTAACECAGRGTCSSGVCQCQTGYIGHDCAITDCGVGANNQRCSGAGNGTCDGERGYCECVDGFDGDANPFFTAGAACGQTLGGHRIMPPLYFDGEYSAAANVTGTPYEGVLRSKEYTYFTFQVPSTQFPMFVELTIAGAAVLSNPSLIVDGDMDGWISPSERSHGYVNTGVAGLPSGLPEPILVAAYATFGKPYASSNQFSISSAYPDELRYAISFSNSGSGTGSFSQTGTMVVGVLAATDAFFSLKLARDGCASLNCTHGECSNGQCVCPRINERTRFSQKYGWTGLLCDVPDCPGFPDCSGSRGTCVVPSAGDAAHADGFPYCACTGLYTGEYCQGYNLPASTRVFGVNMGFADRSGYFSVGLNVLSPNGNVTSQRIGVYNGTFSGIVDVGRNDTPLVLDPSALQSCCNMQPPYTVFAQLTYANSPLADPMLLAQENAYPTLTSYSKFDEGGWRSKSSVHEFVTTLNGYNLLFLTAVNGRYGEDLLRYNLYVEVVSGNCPASLRGCSGHGTCGNGECVCNLGYEGIRCEIPAPVIASADTASVASLDPSKWRYWVHPINDAPNTTVEIVVTMTSMGSPRASPLLSAAFTSSRRADSIQRVTSEIAMFDYKAYKDGTTTQRIVLRRVNPSSQRFLYIGLMNTRSARGLLDATVHVESHSTSSLTHCDTTSDYQKPLNSTCKYLHCNNHGDFILVNGAPQCKCDFGWNPDSYCGSPLFASFAHLAAAGQDIGALCSVCEMQNITLDREGAILLSVPQPLQKSTGLRLHVRPNTGAAMPGRRLVNFVSTLTLQEQIDFGLGRRTQLAVGNTTSVGIESSEGNPALLVSTTFPRSILDFLYVASSQNNNETIEIGSASPTGKYWIALYANTPGDFRLAASRYSYELPVPEEPSFGAKLANWLIGSKAGYIVLAFGALLLVCVCGGCCVQQMTSCCLGKRAAAAALAAAKDDNDAEKKRLRLLRSVRDLQSAMMSEAAQDDPHGHSHRTLSRGSRRFLDIALANSNTNDPNDKNKHVLGAALRAASKRNLDLAAAGLSTRHLGAAVNGQSPIMRTHSGNLVPAMRNPLIQRAQSRKGREVEMPSMNAGRPSPAAAIAARKLSPHAKQGSASPNPHHYPALSPTGMGAHTPSGSSGGIRFPQYAVPMTSSPSAPFGAPALASPRVAYPGNQRGFSVPHSFGQMQNTGFTPQYVVMDPSSIPAAPPRAGVASVPAGTPNAQPMRRHGHASPSPPLRVAEI